MNTVISANMEKDTCPIRSAGHKKHEYAVGTAQRYILAALKYTTPDGQPLNEDEVMPPIENTPEE